MLPNMNDESLRSTIKELEQQGESLELGRLRLELRNRRKQQRKLGGPRRVELKLKTLEDYVERFWSRVDVVDDSKCWIWVGGTTVYGYGCFVFINRHLRLTNCVASRFAFMTTGKTIPVGICVCHKCDVKLCCNPEHYFLGTQADNNHDMWNKGRANIPHGEDHRCAKLTESQVIEIRKLPRSYGSCGRMAKEYGVSINSLKQALYGQTWKHL